MNTTGRPNWANRDTNRWSKRAKRPLNEATWGGIEQIGEIAKGMRPLNKAKWGEMMVKIEEKFAQRIGNVLRACFEWGQIG